MPPKLYELELVGGPYDGTTDQGYSMPTRRLAYRTLDAVDRRAEYEIADMRQVAVRGGEMKYQAGQEVQFCGETWRVSRVYDVTEHEDPEYTQRLYLVQRDERGRVLKIATGIRNTYIG